MRKTNARSLWFVVLLSTAAAWAAEERAAVDEAKTNEDVQVILEISDGSRLVGTPGIATMPVQTSFAKMDVPLKQIQTLRIGADHETVTLDLRNGDKLTGVISPARIKLETLFGPVSIGAEHIKQLTVVRAGGALPESLRKGLVLYYSFDRDEGSVVADKSPERNTGTVCGAKWTAQGAVGGAYEFDGKNGYIAVKLRTDLSDTGDFTVSLWTYVQVRELQGNGDGRGRERQYIFDTHTDAVSGQYRTGFFMVYDLLGSPVIAELHNGIQYQYGSKGDEYCEQSTRVDVVGGWHHMVFARRGLDDYSCLDGKVLDSTYARQVRREGPLNLNHTWSIGACAGNNSPEKRAPFKGRIDEIMVFNRALSADEVKAVYDAQKE